MKAKNKTLTIGVKRLNEKSLLKSGHLYGCMLNTTALFDFSLLCGTLRNFSTLLYFNDCCWIETWNDAYSQHVQAIQIENIYLNDCLHWITLFSRNRRWTLLLLTLFSHLHSWGTNFNGFLLTTIVFFLYSFVKEEPRTMLSIWSALEILVKAIFDRVCLEFCFRQKQSFFFRKR